MSLWVKICGNTTLEDAQLAAVAGADAVGFVFAPSPRRVTTAQVSAITPFLPANLEKIGVFVDSDLEEIVCAVEEVGLTGVQLHFGADSGNELAARLRKRFGTGLRILRVIHFGTAAMEQLRAAANDPGVDNILVDSRTAAAVGGTGVTFDWQTARHTVFAGKQDVNLIAAGGLTPDNVAEAIALLRPWGVDVSSGVEAWPGRKDRVKVMTFIASARQAGLRIASDRETIKA